ncbi:MAG: helix-turn-helix transcriptional regulator [Alphaproteobacteria bacterium]|nr:helix-turn-helix transcriptional regulator [Alphaproteobacteria bacterium]
MTALKKTSLTKKLAERIIALWTERGMTSIELAAKIGLSKSGLRYIERDIKDARIETLARVAEGLKVPIVELFNFGTDRS